MNNFVYYNPTRVVFGKDAIESLKDLLTQHNVRSLLMIYSGEYIVDLGIYDHVVKCCRELDITLVKSGAVVPNPRVELARELITMGREHEVDFILAIGGGSAIDTAKAVALGMLHVGDVWDFFDYSIEAKTALPLGVISTIPASGSETSTASVLSNGKIKAGVESECLLPKFAILDPSYIKSLPKYQLTCGIADITSHLLERYFSVTEDVGTTDRLIEGALQSLLYYSKRLLKNPNDDIARAEIMLLSSIAHNNSLDTGRATDWASHRIEHELSGQYNITHGEGMAIVFSSYIDWIADILPKKPAQLAYRLFGVDPYNHNETEMTKQLSIELKDFFRSLGLKTNLTELGIDDRDFQEMAERATKSGPVGNYYPVHAQDMIEILKGAL